MPYDNERSSLWGIAATGAAGTGAYYGFRGGGVKRLWEAVSSPRRSEILEAVEAAGANIRTYTKHTVDIAPLSLASRVIVPPAQQGMLRFGIANAAYESLMNSSSIGHTRAHGILREIASMSSAEDAHVLATKRILEHGGNPRMFNSRTLGMIDSLSQVSPNVPAVLDQVPHFIKNKADVIARMEDLPEAVAKKARALEEKLTGIFGPGIVIEKEYGVIGKNRDTIMMRAKILGGRADETITLPLTGDNVLYTGKNFQSKYVLRQGWEFEDGTVKLKSYTDVYLSELAKKRGLENMSNNRAIIETNRQIMEQINDDQAAKRLAIFARGEDFSTSSDMVHQSLLKKQAVFVGPRGQIKPELLGRAVDTGQVFALTGQGAAGKMTLFTEDIRKQMYGSRGIAYPLSRQPLQHVREGWTPTAEAMAQVRGMESFSFARPNLANRKAPMVMALYSEGAADWGAKEEGLLREKFKGMFQFEKYESRDLRLGEDMFIHPSIRQSLGGIENRVIGEEVKMTPTPLARGEKLGYSLAGGEVKTHGGFREELVGYKITGQGTIKAQVRQVYDMDVGEVGKYFSPEAKHMMEMAREEDFVPRVQHEIFGLGGKQEQVAGRDIGAILEGERLRKNPWALQTQQMTALMAYAEHDIAGGATGATLENLRAYRADPEKYLGFDKLFDTGGKSVSNRELLGLNTEAQRRIARAAGDLGILRQSEPNRAGLIFGYMHKTGKKDVLTQLTNEGLFTMEQAATIRASRRAVGAMELPLGEPSFAGGAGKLAKLDVFGMRTMSMIGGKEDASLGADMMSMFAGRLQGPSNLAREEAILMQGSLLGVPREGIAQSVGLGDLKNLVDVDLSQEGRAGQWMNVGTDLKELGRAKRVYVPGSASELMAPNMASGEPIASDVSRGFEDLQLALRRRANAQGEEAIGMATLEAERVAASLRTAGHLQYAKAIQPRGEVLGSRYLTGKQLTAGQVKTLGPGVAGVSESTGIGMIQELMDQSTDPNDIKFLEGQMTAFKDNQAISGIGFRHPIVGLESMQPIQIKRLSTAKNEFIYMPETKVANKYIDAAGNWTEAKLVSGSPMVGMKGDFDKDMYNIALVSDKAVDDRTRRLISGSREATYTEYLGQHYAIKRMTDAQQEVYKAATIASGASAVSSEAIEHATGKMAAGPTNIALQKVKVSMMAQDPELYRSLAPKLWALEETAAINVKSGGIAGTHIYSRLGEAINEARTNPSQATTKLESVLTDVFGAAKTEESMIGDRPIRMVHDPAVEARQMVGAVANADEDMLRSVELASYVKKGTLEGKATQLGTQREQFLMREAGLSQDVGQILRTGAATGEQKAMRAGRGLMARARAAKNIFARAKVPIALGLGAGAAIMLASPSISGAISGNPNIEGARGGRNINLEDSRPARGREMSIPEARIIRTPRVYQGSSTRVRSNYSTNDYSNTYSDTIRTASQMRGGNTGLRMNVSDDRQYLNPHMLANKIHERM